MARIATPFLRPVSSRLPRTLLFAMPVRRSFDVRVDAHHRFRYELDDDDTIAKALFWYGLNGYEAHTVRLLSTLAATASVFVDVGANTGVYSMLMAASKDDIVVHAFEPVPGVFSRLCHNAALNGFTNVVAHCQAVSDLSGETVLHVPSGGVPLEASLLAGYRPGTEKVTVPVTTLDDFVSQEGIGRVDVVKIDAEGTTRLVLEGARRTLARDSPVLVCEILYAVDTDAGVGAMLEQCGYRSFQVTPSGLIPDREANGDPGYRHLNYVFVHRDQADRFLSEHGVV